MCAQVWKVSTGAVQRRLDAAHAKGVTSLQFSRDAAHLLSASFDRTVRIHGLKSGKVLKEFRGHTSFVNEAVFTADGHGVLSGSSDGTVRLWALRSAECLGAWKPLGGGGDGADPPVLAVLPLPKNPEHFAVVNRSDTVVIMNMSGQTVRSLSAGRRGGTAACACVSARGRLVLVAQDDGVLYALGAGGAAGSGTGTGTGTAAGTGSGTLDATLPLHDAPPVGLAHHPHHSLLASFAEDGLLKIWKP